MNDEETGKWVILDHFPHSHTDVYGFFDSESEAFEYAERHGFGKNGGAFDVKMVVLNAHYEERRESWE